MLKSLNVANLAIIERAEIEFGPGLNVITGETGAGKSVLMSALDLVLGARADGSSVRDGATEAEVEAVFDDKIVRRTFTREGRSRAWINDESVTLAELKALALSSVDIHGPRANQKLLDETFQRETLDNFGAVALDKYSEAYGNYSSIKAELAALGDELGEDELDFLKFQVNELKSADLTEEDDTLQDRHAAAAHAEEIVASAGEITEGLSGSRGAEDVLLSLRPRFRAAARHFPAAEAWSREADEIIARIQDLSRTVAGEVARLDRGGENLAALDERLSLVNKLKRKYRQADVAGLIKLLEEKSQKLDQAESRDIVLSKLQKSLVSAEKTVRKVGAELTEAREKAGAKLAKAITSELRGLGFLQAKFDVKIESIEPTASGMDRVVFMFEPNPGESARPLASIASSGEIARVMLAAKVVLVAAEANAATLVFDEIDANIGGEVGKVVGEKMREVAKGRQVIAITHLPQSAVYGEKHFVVAKSVSDGRTRTGIKVVDGESRVAEIARMLGGEKLTSVVKKHAQELLTLSR